MWPLRLALERSTLAVCGTCGHGVTVVCSRQIGLAEYETASAAREDFEREYLQARLRSYDRGLRLLGPPNGRRLLDVGSNYGHFLALAASRGWVVAGVEPGESLRRAAVGFAAATVASIDEANALGPFDVVTLWDVLEHLRSPSDQLERFAQLLAPGGIVLVRVPDARIFRTLRSSRLRRLFGQAYLTACHPTNPEEHVSHFTPASLRIIARGSGLQERELIDARYDERTASGRAPVDIMMRRALHSVGRRLPYEFTMTLELAQGRR